MFEEVENNQQILSQFDTDYDCGLVEACQILHEQCQALLESVREWKSLIKKEHARPSMKGRMPAYTELIEGITRLEQAVKLEAQFLCKLLNKEEDIQPFHASGSNFPYLEAVYRCARGEVGLVNIFKPVSFNVGDKWDKLRIDVISNHGSRWIKVSARNAGWLRSQSNFTLIENSMDDNIVVADLEARARLLLHIVDQNKVHFRSPRVCFQFSCFDSCSDEVKKSLTDLLHNLNVEVQDIPSSAPCFDVQQHPSTFLAPWICDPSRLATSFLNLDITTLLALASQLTHGPYYIQFPEAIENKALRAQVLQEQNCPIMPLLVHYLKGRELTTTKSCYDKFQSIVSTISGPTELLRANILFRHHHQDLDLIKKDLACLDDDPFKQWKLLMGNSAAPNIQVLEDNASPVFRKIMATNHLHISFGKIHVAAFGSGHQRQQTTVTANSGVARTILYLSVSSKGNIEFPDRDYCLIHEPRSFAEVKLTEHRTSELKRGN